MKTIFFAFVFILHFISQAQVHTGVATHFEKLGSPYGGCGIPTELVDSEHFVALNVFNAPNAGHQDYTRPINGTDTVLMGEFANGKNCGRWVKVTIGENCIDGINDGALGETFCRGGTWQDDKYSGAELYMVVTDACGDNNGWCRDSEFHLDLHTSSLNQFEKNGIPVGDMYPLHFNNRKIYWEYIKAPNYSGDIEIYFLQHAQHFWPAIMINHLENGVLGIEQKINGSWHTVERNSDMGQAFTLQDTGNYTIRVIDVDGNYINNGREYTFRFPEICEGKCMDAATIAPYTSFTPHPTQKIELTKGWNLVSLYIQPHDSFTGSVFPNATYIKNLNEFYVKDIPAYLNPLKEIVTGKGYLVNNSIDETIELTGSFIDSNPSPTTLSKGWNLIGIPQDTSVKDLPEEIIMIKNFGRFYNKTELSSIDTLVKGQAYFIKTNSNQTIVWK